MNAPASRLRFWWLVFGLLVLLLAACNSENRPAESGPAPTQAVQAATPPARPTRIVTFPPPPTPTLTPTLSYDIVPVGGSWAMRFYIEMTGSTYVDRLWYSGAADVQVNLDGTIGGTGYLSPNIWDNECAARVLDDEPLSFTVRGTTRAEGDRIFATVEIVPDAPDARENYALVCPNFNDVRYRREPILWPVLRTLGRLTWDFALESGQTFPFESDLAAQVGGTYDGQLRGEVTINRE